ncbi:AAA family ATPase [Jannaschia donghaensis]|uniref:Cytochrome c biogenesis protein CcmA n=1 Tax=Jannaschia donghaensis TaxID=420998 RepID=A0A0M6YDI0_9RHOB|nr:AAA family ATPase [Jannaschia donghaensis]CTQ48401.1 cytochrome c biogenesis protein CcmA [Jannaschia donghaensis]
MARRSKPTRLPAPFLQRLSVLDDVLAKQSAYPFDLPWLRPAFELTFDTPVTVIVGENGTGKSTLIEAIAALAGYSEGGGAKGFGAVDSQEARESGGRALVPALRAGWLPKVTAGWFFRAETFFSVARWMDSVGSDADYLSWSHGEGFMRLFQERMNRQGLFILDEPESALFPRRQLEFLRMLDRVQRDATAQIIMATHSPILMAVPGARVLQVRRHGIDPVDYRETRHFRLYQDFTVDPEGFVAEALRDEDQSQF